jgi:hypothetical protein
MPQLMKKPADIHKQTKCERNVALAAISDTGVNRNIPSLLSAATDLSSGGVGVLPAPYWNQFQSFILFRHDFLCTFLISCLRSQLIGKKRKYANT